MFLSFISQLASLSIPYVVTELPPELLPPELSVSVAELEADFMSEIWQFFAYAVPMVVLFLLLRSWIRTF